MKTFNGHRNYNAWNVSLWLNNDEGLYREMQRCIRRSYRGRDHAAQEFLEFLKECNLTHTPDGVPYTKTNIILAMRGIS